MIVNDCEDLAGIENLWTGMSCAILMYMEIILNIPDELARQVAAEGKDPSRVALEALALEGYRAERLSESTVRQMLGFESRIQVHAFLKEHGVHLHYDLSDLDRDRVTSERLRAKPSGPEPADEPRLG
jgi:Uncharacterised protein family (UPF0175)